MSIRRFLILAVMGALLPTVTNASADCPQGQQESEATRLAATLHKVDAGGAVSPCWSQAAGLSGTDDLGGRPAHVHLMHLDGFRPDLFEQLLDGGQLPNFEFLRSRGRVSFDATTVDKSETMKVIPSYLTSKRDTRVVGWWQFNREAYSDEKPHYSLFENFWLNPTDVVRYAIGVDTVVHPTILDYVSYTGGNPMGGFNLHRRGIKCRDYTRAYKEGAEAAVMNKTYLKQADETMNGVQERWQEITANGEPLPRLSTSLLAPADEFSHAEGIVMSVIDGEPALPDGVRIQDWQLPYRGKTMKACFDRSAPDKRRSDPHERLFALLDAARASKRGALYEHQSKYFREVKAAGGEVTSVCIDVPALKVYDQPSGGADSSQGPGRWAFATPDYALGMIAVDIQVGELRETMRGIHCENGKLTQGEEPAGLSGYSPAEDSLFDHTTFLFFGDHGMVDTKNKMTKPDPSHPDRFRRDGLRESYIESLNRDLGLETPVAGEEDGKGDRHYGIDPEHLPDRLAIPYKHVGGFFVGRKLDPIRKDAQAMADMASKWAGLGAGMLGQSREGAESKAQALVDRFMEMRLRQEPAYVEMLRGKDRSYLNHNVALVYGGGARNNAELFIPGESHRVGRNGTRPDWDKRPTLDQILSYRPGGSRAPTLISVLQDNPGTGLIFIRKHNEDFSARKPKTNLMDHFNDNHGKLPERAEILVLDRHGNEGTITVWPDEATGELVFQYQSDGPDPLGYGDLGEGAGTVGTYAQWMQWSVERGHYYHNAVAGMGSYLYSQNPSIGDITVTHAQGWNFGGNAGGHGGVHSGEKKTMMMVSGVGVDPGQPLTSSAQYQAVRDADGTVHVERKPFQTAPSLLDVAPTALSLLGVTPEQFADFAANDFRGYLRSWKRGQADDLLSCVDSSAVAAAAESLGVDSDAPRTQVREFLKGQLDPILGEPNDIPDYDASYRMDGNVLTLGR